MIAVATGSRTDLGVSTLNLMHKFRHEVFVKRLGWRLAEEDGQETDQYDSEYAKYVVVTDVCGHVTGTARLLPTTRPYMLPDLFRQLLAGNPAPSDSKVWELSRFATSTTATKDGRVLSLSDRTLDLLQQVFGLARQLGVTRLLLVTSIGIERLMLRAGLASHRMAPPATVNDELCVALFIEVPAVGVVGDARVEREQRDNQLRRGAVREAVDRSVSVTPLAGSDVGREVLPSLTY